MTGAKYAEERPPKCSLCHFWVNDRVGCRLGKMNCYYLLDSPRMDPTLCDGCPYKKSTPCMGWCTKRVLGQEGVDSEATKINAG